MADEGSAKENEGDKKIVHTYPLVKVCILIEIHSISHKRQWLVWSMIVSMEGYSYMQFIFVEWLFLLEYPQAINSKCLIEVKYLFDRFETVYKVLVGISVIYPYETNETVSQWSKKI